MVTFLNVDMLSCVETAGNPECQGVGWGGYRNSQFPLHPPPPPPLPSRERRAPLHSLQSTTSSYYYVAYYFFYP